MAERGKSFHDYQKYIPVKYATLFKPRTLNLTLVRNGVIAKSTLSVDMNSWRVPPPRPHLKGACASNYIHVARKNSSDIYADSPWKMKIGETLCGADVPILYTECLFQANFTNFITIFRQTYQILTKPMEVKGDKSNIFKAIRIVTSKRMHRASSKFVNRFYCLRNQRRRKVPNRRKFKMTKAL